MQTRLLTWINVLCYGVACKCTGPDEFLRREAEVYANEIELISMIERCVPGDVETARRVARTLDAKVRASPVDVGGPVARTLLHDRIGVEIAVGADLHELRLYVYLPEDRNHGFGMTVEISEMATKRCPTRMSD
ncbi:hypothetical protein ACNOYE_06675 [Nannocystaceae bacterium ST9]